jgi:hypothetical protein
MGFLFSKPDLSNINNIINEFKKTCNALQHETNIEYRYILLLYVIYLKSVYDLKRSINDPNLDVCGGLKVEPYPPDSDFIINEIGQIINNLKDNNQDNRRKNLLNLKSILKSSEMNVQSKNIMIDAIEKLLSNSVSEKDEADLFNEINNNFKKFQSDKNTVPVIPKHLLQIKLENKPKENKSNNNKSSESDDISDYDLITNVNDESKLFDTKSDNKFDTKLDTNLDTKSNTNSETNHDDRPPEYSTFNNLQSLQQQTTPPPLPPTPPPTPPLPPTPPPTPPPQTQSFQQQLPQQYYPTQQFVPQQFIPQPLTIYSQPQQCPNNDTITSSLSRIYLNSIGINDSLKQIQNTIQMLTTYIMSCNQFK